jgi:uncharacterized RDD family membrane protein YckC
MMARMQPAAALSEPLDTTVEVETPEHVRFRYQIAGPARRAAAYVIDFAARGLLVLALGIALFITFTTTVGRLGGFEIGAMLVAYFVVEWGYYVISELLMNGSSLGKKALRLRVVQSNGLPITFTDSLLRNLVRAADLLPNFYAIGLLSMIMDSKFRRLGDLAAGTIVIHEPATRFGRPSTAGRFMASDPRTAVHPDHELPQRPQLSREERQALALFSRRQPMLSPQRAEELADLIAPALAKRWGVHYRSSAAFLEAVHQKASLQLMAGAQ